MKALALVALLCLAAAPATSGKWVAREDVDPMTDGVSISATYVHDKGAFSVKCPPSKKIEVVFRTSDFFGEGVRSIGVRFDDAEPREELWRYQDQIAFPVKKDGDAIMVGRMLWADRLRLRGITYRHQFIDADIDLVAGRDEIRKVASACGMQWQQE